MYMVWVIIGNCGWYKSTEKKLTLRHWWGVKQSSKNYISLHLPNTSNRLAISISMFILSSVGCSQFNMFPRLHPICSPLVKIDSAAAQLCGFIVWNVIFLSILNVWWCIYYMVWVIIGHCGRYKVRVHNWSSHPWQVQLTGVRGGGPSSLPPLHAAQREKGRSVNECTPESHHLLPPP